MTFANTTVTEPLRVLRLKYNVLYKGETVHLAEEQKFTHLLLFSLSAPWNIISNINEILFATKTSEIQIREKLFARNFLGVFTERDKKNLAKIQLSSASHA